MPLFKRIYRYFCLRGARAVLVGRMRDRGNIEKGRFTREDANRIMDKTWVTFDELIDGAPVQKTAGGRRNVTLGVLTLAFYRALRSEVDDRSYTIELTSDFCWYGYEKSLGPSRFVARLRSRDPQTQMNFIMRSALRYPFSRPDYDWTVHQDPSAFVVDFHRCPVHDYFKSQGDDALDLFRNTSVSYTHLRAHET